MANPLADNWSFGVAGALPEGQLLIAAYADDMLREGVPETILLWFNGVRFSIVGTVNDYVRSIKVGRQKFIVASEDGLLLKISNGGIESRVDLRNLNLQVRPLGPIRSCHVADGLILIAGLNDTVLTYDESARLLSNSSQGLIPEKTRGIEALDGYGLSEIYGVDLTGGIWRYDGSSWHDCSSPTNLLLTCVICTNSGAVYAAGRHGVLLSGRHNTWKVLDFELDGFDIYSLAEWKSELYLSGPRGILKLMPNDEGVDVVDFGSIDASSFYYVIGAGEILWSVGPKDILFYKDGRWTSLFR